MSNDMIARSTSANQDLSYGGFEQLDSRHKVFLPASHDLADQGTLHISRFVIIMIISTVAAAFAWASLSQVEVVSTAVGKVIPSGRAKVIRPMEDGVVRSILIRDGQKVSRDDELIQLDQTETKADIDRLTESINAEELHLARLQAMMLTLSRGDRQVTNESFIVPPSATADQVEAARRLMRASLNAHFASLDSHDQQLNSIDAELSSSQARVEELHATLPLLRERVTVLQSLVERKLIARPSLLAQREELIRREHALRQSYHEVDRLRAKLGSHQAMRDQAIADYRNELLEEAHAIERRLLQLNNDLVKASNRHALKILRAPIDGVVENLSIFTESGVVEAASDLMTIVPTGTDLEIEAYADNKDIGFIEVGQKATVKLHAFPFVRYGVIEGEVFDIANDSVQTEDGAWHYAVRIRSLDDAFVIKGREVAPVPGMTANVDILTGHRSVISFVFEPIIESLREALRER